MGIHLTANLAYSIDTMIHNGTNKSQTESVEYSDAYIQKLYDNMTNANGLPDSAVNKLSFGYNIKQPFIIRGIQRKGKSKPQFWGFDSMGASIGDTLIRGGALTQADRIATDALRLGKWIASPNGIAWVTEQIGLGLCNPNVETNNIIAPTKIHTGAISLLSLAGNATGAHFAKHSTGFPDALLGKYSDIQSTHTSIYDNRLVKLLGDTNTLSKISNNTLFSTLSTIGGKNNKILPTISGLSGPDSLYGIGWTIGTMDFDIKEGLNKSRLEDNMPKNALSLSDTTIDDYISKNDILDTTILPNTPYSLDTPKKYYTTIIRERESNTAQTNAFITKQTSKLDTIPSNNTTDISLKSYLVSSYKNIKKDDTSFNDFRKNILTDIAPNTQASNILGTTNTDYQLDNRETLFGEGKYGSPDIDKSISGAENYLYSASQFYNDTDKSTRQLLSNDNNFNGDRINALDTGHIQKTNIADTPNQLMFDQNVYGAGKRDYIRFYFGDAYIGKAVFAFRASITGLQDSFNPQWNSIDIMGRPDKAYQMSGFERRVNFSFTVAAMSRAEMIPMWRKLNYLASYTMPEIDQNTRRYVGPLMRITIGDLYYQTPCILTSLDYRVPDNAPWDIALDSEDVTKNTLKKSGVTINSNEAKQLPTIIDVNVGLNMIMEWRPVLFGRSYSLSRHGSDKTNYGQWLGDSIMLGTSTADRNK
jgi:hypothetical protein